MIAELQTAISKVPSRKARLQGLTQGEAVKIKVERYALLFRGAPVAIAATAINASITVAVAWSDIAHGVLFGWAGAVLTLAFIRACIWLRYRMGGASARNLSRFARIHVFFMAINGAMWGSLAPIFAVHGMIDHAFLPFVIAGTAAAAIVSAGASWRAVVAFNVPALAPLATVYALTAGADGLAIAGVVILYGCATTYLALTTQRMIDRSILLHTRNVKMFSALQKRVDDAHEAEQRFRALVESSQEITIIFSPEGRITYASPAVEKTLGVPPHQLIGLTTKHLVHPDDIAVFRSAGEKALSKLGEVLTLPHVCLRGADADTFVPVHGRLTNMLYVPGVEGFVFSGGLLDEQKSHHIHAAE
ncbi:MAG: PAS domain S-box protein [Pseudomonadota bacterium]